MRLFYSLLFFASFFSSLSQIRQPRDYSEIKGILMDTLTSLPISSAHIWTKNFKTVSGLDGSFSILILPEDTLCFSHINYFKKILSLHTLKDQPRLRITMKQKVQLLEAVDVYPLLSEEKFKQKILETHPVETIEEQNAKKNMAILNYYIKSLPPVSMNANENYREYMKGPQGVIIFSTHKQKGLIKAIRDVIKTKPPPYKDFSKENKSHIDLLPELYKSKLTRPKPDSLKSATKEQK